MHRIAADPYRRHRQESSDPGDRLSPDTTAGLSPAERRTRRVPVVSRVEGGLHRPNAAYSSPAGAACKQVSGSMRHDETNRSRRRISFRRPTRADWRMTSACIACSGVRSPEDPPSPVPAARGIAGRRQLRSRSPNRPAQPGEGEDAFPSARPDRNRPECQCCRRTMNCAMVSSERRAGESGRTVRLPSADRTYCSATPRA